MASSGMLPPARPSGCCPARVVCEWPGVRSSNPAPFFPLCPAARCIVDYDFCCCFLVFVFVVHGVTVEAECGSAQTHPGLHKGPLWGPHLCESRSKLPPTPPPPTLGGPVHSSWEQALLCSHIRSSVLVSDVALCPLPTSVRIRCLLQTCAYTRCNYVHLLLYS